MKTVLYLKKIQLLIILFLSLFFIFDQLNLEVRVAIANIHEKIDRTKTEIINIEKAIAAINEAIKKREQQIRDLENEFRETELSLLKLESDIFKIETSLRSKNQLYHNRLRSLYMQENFSLLEMIISSKNYADIIIKTNYITSIVTSDKKLLDDINNEQNSLKLKRNETSQNKIKLENLRDQKDGERRNLLSQRKEKDKLLIAAKKRLEAELIKITPQAELKPIYGVVIDNFISARPQSGIAKASLIYEYEVEGGITRFLALFSSLPKKVGPMRSARSHSIILAMENKVNYIYASAGTDILIQIRDWKVNSTNAIVSANSSFFRDRSRKAPFNLYVNLTTLGAEVPSKEVVIKPAYLSRGGEEASEINVVYSNNYQVKYVYDLQNRFYKRYINNRLHVDASGENIKARNILIQYAPYGIDILGRPTPNLIGTGKVEFYSQGQKYDGYWKKSSINTPTNFYYQDGKEIEMVYGQTWIHINRIKSE